MHREQGNRYVHKYDQNQSLYVVYPQLFTVYSLLDISILFWIELYSISYFLLYSM